MTKHLTHLTAPFEVAKCLFLRFTSVFTALRVRAEHARPLAYYFSARLELWEAPSPPVPLPPPLLGCELKSLTAGREATTQETGMEGKGREQWKSTELK